MIQRALIKTVSGEKVFIGPLGPPVTEDQIRRALAQQHTIKSCMVCGKDKGTFKAIVADPVEAPVEAPMVEVLS